MGQKVNPHGLRVGVIKDWDSRWYAGKATFGDTLVEDFKIREYLKKKLYKAGIPDIEIERDAARVKIHIHCAQPGMVIGQKGAEIEKLRTELEKMTNGKPVNINIIEVKNRDMNAQLIAENIASQLEGRVSFRRAMKTCIGRTMKCGAKGIKTQVTPAPPREAGMHRRRQKELFRRRNTTFCQSSVFSDGGGIFRVAAQQSSRFFIFLYSENAKERIAGEPLNSIRKDGEQ